MFFLFLFLILYPLHSNLNKKTLKSNEFDNYLFFNYLQIYIEELISSEEIKNDIMKKNEIINQILNEKSQLNQTLNQINNIHTKHSSSIFNKIMFDSNENNKEIIKKLIDEQYPVDLINLFEYFKITIVNNFILKTIITIKNINNNLKSKGKQ
jgi:hypothetical protein